MSQTEAAATRLEDVLKAEGWAITDRLMKMSLAYHLKASKGARGVIVTEEFKAYWSVKFRNGSDTAERQFDDLDGAVDAAVGFVKNGTVPPKRQ